MNIGRTVGLFILTKLVWIIRHVISFIVYLRAIFKKSKNKAQKQVEVFVYLTVIKSLNPSSWITISADFRIRCLPSRLFLFFIYRKGISGYQIPKKETCMRQTMVSSSPRVRMIQKLSSVSQLLSQRANLNYSLSLPSQCESYAKEVTSMFWILEVWGLLQFYISQKCDLKWWIPREESALGYISRKLKTGHLVF